MSQLEMPLSDVVALQRTSITCWTWWRYEIRPRIGVIMEHFPECVMPSQLLPSEISKPMLTAIDAAAQQHMLEMGFPAEALRQGVIQKADEAERMLSAFMAHPSEATREHAFAASRELVAAVRAIPKSVVLP